MPVRRLLRETLPPWVKDRLWSVVGSRSTPIGLRMRAWSERFRGHRLPGRRRSRSDLTYNNHWTVFHGIIQHQWRGVPMLKHPIEVALYPQLFWEQKPGTIFEIGSFAGGSAIYYSDVLATYGLPCRIFSLDINVPSPPIRPANVEYLRADAADLGAVLTPSFLAECPRPWLVIEDASHMRAHTLAVMRFFDPLLRSGEYLVIEDGNVTEMGQEPEYDGGPSRAIEEFLREADGRYEIDRRYCDRFGHNVTGNPNGYLRRR